MRNLRIGELASLAGVTTRTVRYYEKMGLLCTQERTDGGQRLYTDNDLIYLLRILQLKDFGLSLDEIARIVLLRNEDASGEKRRHELMAQYKNLIEKEEKHMADIQTLLNQLKKNLNQLENSENAFQDCPGSACPECPLKDSCIFPRALAKL